LGSTVTFSAAVGSYVDEDREGDVLDGDVLEGEILASWTNIASPSSTESKAS
jgi:hypothetical protein